VIELKAYFAVAFRPLTTQSIDVLNVQKIINVNKRVYYDKITNVSKC